MQRMAFHTLNKAGHSNRNLQNRLIMLQRSQRIMAGMDMSMRRMMSTAAAAVHLNPELSLEDVQRLHRLQNEFEKDP